jgi:DNA-binding transcriptional LysR family regulator
MACNRLPAHVAAVRAGVGAGMLPCFIGDAEPGLRRVEYDAASISRDLWMVFHRDLKASMRVRAMADFLAEDLGI